MASSGDPKVTSLSLPYLTTWWPRPQLATPSPPPCPSSCKARSCSLVNSQLKHHLLREAKSASERLMGGSVPWGYCKGSEPADAGSLWPFQWQRQSDAAGPGKDGTIPDHQYQRCRCQQHPPPPASGTTALLATWTRPSALVSNTSLASQRTRSTWLADQPRGPPTAQRGV